MRPAALVYRLAVVALLLGSLAGVRGARAADAAHERRLLVCGSRTAIVRLAADRPDEQVEWVFPAGSREGWVLPDGNVLLAVSKGARLPIGDVVKGGAAVEVRRGSDGAADEIVWRHDGTQEEINSIQKTPAGTYVLTEAGPNPRLLEIAADGTVKVEIPLVCQKQNAHMQSRMARKQADGTYLVPHLLDFVIIRYGADGTVLGRIDTHVPGEPKLNSWPFTAISLPDGGLLAALTNGNRVVEFAADGEIRWQATAADTDGAINDACGVQRLPNGNTMIASYRIGKGGVRLVEVRPDRSVAWTWNADVPGVHHFHLFEQDGVRVPDPALR